jgi:hypothetical protein
MDSGDSGTAYGIANVAPTKSRSWLMYGLGAVALLFVGYLIYAWIRSATGKPLPSLFAAGAPASEDQMPTAVDGKERKVISASSAPIGQGADHGIQFWMYIKDWDYKFGQPKDIVKRVAGNNSSIYNPRIALHPTDNSLQVSVKYYSQSTGSSTTSAGSTNSSGDVFTCTVENVPLQAWFSVSVTIFDRNMDIYINGRLVKSCVIPGVPRPATGDIIVNDNGGFSGSICNLRAYGNMLSPTDAQTFFAAGTSCGVAGMKQSDDSSFAKIFGYTFRFAVLDYKGSEVNEYTF